MLVFNPPPPSPTEQSKHLLALLPFLFFPPRGSEKISSKGRWARAGRRQTQIPRGSGSAGTAMLRPGHIGPDLTLYLSHPLSIIFLRPLNTSLTSPTDSGMHVCRRCIYVPLPTNSPPTRAHWRMGRHTWCRYKRVLGVLAFRFTVSCKSLGSVRFVTVLLIVNYEMMMCLENWVPLLAVWSSSEFDSE